MVDTVFQRKEKIKKTILGYLDKKIKEDPHNPHNFTLSGISVAVGSRYDLEEVKDALDELSDVNEDDQLVQKYFETEVYIPRSDETFAQKFKEYLISPNITFWGAAIITVIAYYTPFSIFNYPESFKAGFLGGLWVMAIFGRKLGKIGTKNYSQIIEKISKASSIKKLYISVILITTAILLAILFAYSYYVNGMPYDKVPSLWIVTTIGVGFTVGSVIYKLIFYSKP